MTAAADHRHSLPGELDGHTRATAPPPARATVGRRMAQLAVAGAHITMCAWCKRVEIDGAWILPPVEALTAADASLRLSHGICPRCIAGE